MNLGGKGWNAIKGNNAAMQKRLGTTVGTSNASAGVVNFSTSNQGAGVINYGGGGVAGVSVPTFSTTTPPASGTAGSTNPNSVPNTGGKICTQYLTVTPLEKLNGKYVPGQPVHVPPCPPKPRVKICGQRAGVGKGDTFTINGKSITLSGSSDINVIAQEIRAQAGDEVHVNLDHNKSGEKCINIKKFR